MRRLLAWTATALFLPIAMHGQAQPKATPRWKDVELKKSIEERLARSAIAVNKFRVEVTDGVVRITGKTDVMQHKGVATRLAKSMGAKVVKNEIEITDAARQRAAAQLLRGKKTGVSEPRP